MDATNAIFAYAKNSAKDLKALLEGGAKPDAKAQDGSAVTLAAAGGGNLDALKFALSLDPNVNERTLDGRNVIHMVIENKFGADDQAMIRYLVDRGAVLEAKDVQGHTPGLMVNRSGPQALRVIYIQLLKDHGIESVFH